jgi:hypothetical protein
MLSSRHDTQPTLEPVELTYCLFLLRTGRTAFRRWRWELWHGPQLLAAGWRLNALHAQRALRVHALGYAHRLHGLHLLRPDAVPGPEMAWGRSPVAVDSGHLRVVLRPREVAGTPAAG